MRTDEDFVSVVIPAYNAQTTIEETVRSVIKQTHRSLEILIVDDGSTDKTAEIVRHMIEQDSRIRLLQQKNQGVAAARNLAISQAKGDLIAVLDADDTWHPEKLARQIERLQQAGAKTGLVYCWFHVVDENGQEVSPANPCLFEGDVLPVLILFNFIGHCSGHLIRRS